MGSVAEARLAIAHGAAAIGLVSSMPSGPGVIPESLIAEIARTVPPGIDSFLLTCETDARTIIAQVRRCGVNTVQIVDRLTRGSYDDIRAALPGVRIVQVIHVSGEAALDEALRLGRRVDAILLDSGRPARSVKELGGTGRTHDWSISSRIRESVQLPVYLAGGLNTGNVAAAIRQVQPFAVDVCAGVRSAGRLDQGKLAAFIDAVHHG